MVYQVSFPRRGGGGREGREGGRKEGGEGGTPNATIAV